MSELRYIKGAERQNLQIGECTINGVGGCLALLVFCYRDISDGTRSVSSVPVRPNGENGGDEHAWGLNQSGPNRWQVSPSARAHGYVALVTPDRTAGSSHCRALLSGRRQGFRSADR